ncbi:MAG TPA: hypothetical protein VF553_14915 [Pyrinomonadaceae bacterium]|jgi:hypothetical protein
MFQELKTGVDILQSALDLRSNFIKRKRRRELLFDLLTFYFCLSRLIQNGRELLSVAGREPLKKIMALPTEERLKFSSKVYALLLTQRLLLRKLSRLIQGQPVMEIFDPALKDELQKLIGWKDKGLLAVGSTLEFYFLLDGRPSRDEIESHGEELARFQYQASVVSIVLSGRSRKVLNMRSILRNLESLEEAGERLRAKINELFTNEEQLEFVKKAKKVADSI